MLSLFPLSALGDRIVILGPSNAGKSTLALALSEKLNLPTVHLDQLHHLPFTDWQARSEEEFKTLHDNVILQEKWIMDGNYSRLMPQRLVRATGVILITSNRWLRLVRYLKRTLINSSSRLGGLEGAPEYVKWEMISFLLSKTPASGARYLRMVESVECETVICRTARDLKKLYREWGLSEPNSLSGK